MRCMTIKLRQMRQIVNDYHLRFPEWTVIQDDVLARENGPVMQGIRFDRATLDVYRPMGFVRVLTVPSINKAMELPQRLKKPNGAPDRWVTLRNHANELEVIVRELHRQLQPRIDRPLDPHNVLEIYEGLAIPTLPEACSLATLSAYLGLHQKAERWCEVFRELASKLPDLNSDIHLARVRIIDELETWLQNNNARDRLEPLLQSQRRILGLSQDT